ncbi:GNAT family N-acetyltransferase [Salidesulfovibrio onnuriiensis]|uniref:GNAT family N-acetyltransferase n=1 Tax=Salidesulfovibrio onnuriiensis TaxID=2583823 RepID=UPI0011C7D12F|nr:GNAT family N-acetyltransferase [Salidesulfovibrio onnuriiensis]
MLTNTYFLKSERMGFRCWGMEDLDLAVSLWGDPEVTRFIDARGELRKDLVRERLEQEILRHKESGVQYWPIFRLEDGEFVGCCGLRSHDRERAVLEIGFHIRRAHWGQGYATEAARAVIAYAFGSLGASALFAGHNPANTASARLLEKLGFVYTHDEFYPPTGLLHPSYLLQP